jgi:hypothetical protein
MTSIRHGKFFSGALAAILLMSIVGCSPITTMWWLFQGDGKKAPTYPLEPINKDRKDVRIVVMAANGPGMTWEFAGVDRDVAVQSAKQIAEGTAKEKIPIKIIRPEDVDRYKTSHPNWRTMELNQIAKELNADYLIDVSITGIGLYQSGAGNIVYQGWVTADVVVHQSGQSTPKHEYHHNTKMPPSAGDSMPAAQYKSEVVKRFASELAMRHMKHEEDRARVAPLE